MCKQALQLEAPCDPSQSHSSPGEALGWDLCSAESGVSGTRLRLDELGCETLGPCCACCDLLCCACCACFAATPCVCLPCAVAPSYCLLASDGVASGLKLHLRRFCLCLSGLLLCLLSLTGAKIAPLQAPSDGPSGLSECSFECCCSAKCMPLSSSKP